MEPTTSTDMIPMMTVAAIGAALLLVAIIIFFALSTLRSIKSEFAKVKELLVKIAEGSLKVDIPHGQFKESAEVFAVIGHVAQNLQRQREAVTILAYSDHLTNLANRMRFEDELTRGFNFAKRGLTISVALIRMNDFRSLSEGAGRTTGEHVLQLCADTLRQSIRKTDVAARFDADEFALILAGMDSSKISEWLAQVDQRFVEAQRKDEALSGMEPRRLRFGYSYVNDKTDKDARDVMERAHKALGTTQDASPIMSA